MENGRSLIQGAAIGIYRSKADGRLVDANPALVAILGYGSVEELLAVDFTNALYRQPETRQRVLEEVRTTGRLAGAEVEWLRKDRRPVLVRLSGRAVPSGIPDEDDFEVIVEEVSELRRIEDELCQLRKLATVGQLAGGVAHNFNNLLTSILGFTEWLLSENPTDAHRSALKEIERAGRQAASLTRQLLAFSSTRPPSPDGVDVNVAIRTVCQLMSDLVRRDIRISFVESAATAVVNIELTQIEQAVVHLILNAQDALPRGGHVRIAAGLVEQLPPGVIPPPIAWTGSWVSLRVADDGEGMSPDVKGQAFEPFFTTRRPDGVGLGLSAVHGIVRQNDGSIGIETIAGGGSALTLFFPQLTPSPRELAETPASDARRLIGPPTVLVVDDHAAIRTLVRRVLGPHGYRVIEAGTGDEAVASSEREAIDVLLVDGRLDGEDGAEVAQRLAARIPNLAVVFMSGGFAVEGSLAGIGGVSAISKPFDPETLVSAVQQALIAQPVRT
jgi:signal transduction histidine kinase